MFVAPLEADFGWTRSQTSLIFTISLITFSLGMLAAGWLHSRGLSKRALFAAAALVAAGFVICSQANSLMTVYVGYGVLVGLSIGFCSNTVISMALRWYPDKQGFASGSLLMGFGMGAVLLSPLVTMLLGVVSWRQTFLLLGVVFGAAFIVVALRIRAAPADMRLALGPGPRHRTGEVGEHAGVACQHPPRQLRDAVDLTPRARRDDKTLTTLQRWTV